MPIPSRAPQCWQPSEQVSTKTRSDSHSFFSIMPRPDPIFFHFLDLMPRPDPIFWSGEGQPARSGSRRFMHSGTGETRQERTAPAGAVRNIPLCQKSPLDASRGVFFTCQSLLMGDPQFPFRRLPRAHRGLLLKDGEGRFAQAGSSCVCHFEVA